MAVTFAPKVVKHLMDGEWPDGKGTVWEGFSFDSVDHWELEVDASGARLVPTDGELPVPGPDIWLIPVVGTEAWT